MDRLQRIEIGHRLRQRRTELGLTRDKMSELADIGSGYYGQLEVDTALPVAQRLHCLLQGGIDPYHFRVGVRSSLDTKRRQGRFIGVFLHGDICK